MCKKWREPGWRREDVKKNNQKEKKYYFINKNAEL